MIIHLQSSDSITNFGLNFELGVIHVGAGLGQNCVHQEINAAAHNGQETQGEEDQWEPILPIGVIVVVVVVVVDVVPLPPQLIPPAPNDGDRGQHAEPQKQQLDATDQVQALHGHVDGQFVGVKVAHDQGVDRRRAGHQLQQVHQNSGGRIRGPFEQCIKQLQIVDLKIVILAKKIFI